jgi:hypothetical protein
VLALALLDTNELVTMLGTVALPVVELALVFLPADMPLPLTPATAPANMGGTAGIIAAKEAWIVGALARCGEAEALGRLKLAALTVAAAST